MVAAERLPVLYHLAAEFNDLVFLLEEPDQDIEAIEVELHRVVGDIRTKGHGAAVVIQALEGMAEFQKVESQRLAAKAKANAAHADRIRNYVMACMQSIGEDRIETGVFTLAIRKNPVSARVTDPELLPDKFWRQPPIPAPVPDLVAIKAHAKATGEVAPGVTLEQTPRLEVR